MCRCVCVCVYNIAERYVYKVPDTSPGKSGSLSVIVTLAKAVGETKAPGAGPR